MTDLNQGASIEAELLPCPFCGCAGLKASSCSPRRHTIECEDCPCRAEFFSSTREQAITAWNRRTPAAAVGAGGLPPLPKCVAYGIIGLTGIDPNDGHRKLSGVSVGKPGAWCKNSLAELFTAEQYREGQRAAIAADRAQRKQAALQEIIDIGQEIEAGAALSVKTWQERAPEAGSYGEIMDAMGAEIADLRAKLASEQQAKEYEQRHAAESEIALAKAHAQLAAKGQGEPVYRDRAGLNQFIELYCGKDSRLIACAEAAWNRCMTLNPPTGAAPASEQPADPSSASTGDGWDYKPAEDYQDFTLPDIISFIDALGFCQERYGGEPFSKKQAVTALSALRMLQPRSIHDFGRAPGFGPQFDRAVIPNVLVEWMTRPESAISPANPGAQPDQRESAAEAKPEAEQDPLYDKAVQIVRATQRASLSLVQRHLMIGHNRSARLFEAMEKAGVVSAHDANGHRAVIQVGEQPTNNKGESNG
jgi:hypothetical protein